MPCRDGTANSCRAPVPGLLAATTLLLAAPAGLCSERRRTENPEHDPFYFQSFLLHPTEETGLEAEQRGCLGEKTRTANWPRGLSWSSEYPLPWLKVGVEESPHLPGQCETGHTEEALVGRCEDQPSSHGQGRRGPKAWSGPGDQTWSVPGRCPAGLFWVPQNMTYIITADAGTESGRL